MRPDVDRHGQTRGRDADANLLLHLRDAARQDHAGEKCAAKHQQGQGDAGREAARARSEDGANRQRDEDDAAQP